MSGTVQVRTIPAGEFKAKCLQLMDEVAATGQTIVVTKRGKPVAQLISADEPKPFRSLWGRTRGSIEIVGDIIGPIEEDWGTDPDIG